MGYSDKDRELLENLDKILEDRENEITDSQDNDTKSALELVRKVASLGEQPSEEFTENMKAMIVQRLAEIESKEKDDIELTYWGIPRRKLWQGTIAALIPVLIVLIIYIIVLLVNR